MDQRYSTIYIHSKGSHLTLDERIFIEVTFNYFHWKTSRIAKALHRSFNTIKYELHRGETACYCGRVLEYCARDGQRTYEEHRLMSCRHYFHLKDKKPFFDYVVHHFYEDGWSIDACAGRALTHGGFTKEQTVCTKTLYKYIDLGLLPILNIDLPQKVKRMPRKDAPCRINKRIFGTSIEKRPDAVDERKTFGHWEADLVIGSKEDDNALLVLIERMTREYLIIRIPDKKPESVMAAIAALRATYSEHADDIFKSITSDNGSEFSKLAQLEQNSQTRVYFTHPYSSFEKGSIERHNGLIRRFIPKKTRIKDVSDEELSHIELWCNNMPRRLFKYRTADELFEEQLDLIYKKSHQKCSAS